MQLESNQGNRKVNSMKAVICLLAVVFASNAMAIQKIKVKDGGTYAVKISSNDMTRIAMDGISRIDNFRGVANSLDIDPDNEAGELYVRPKPQTSGAAMSFFISDDNGYVYTLVATQHDIPAETILLQPVSERRDSITQGAFKSDSYMKHIKSLMKSMATHAEMDGYDIKDIHQPIPLWKETQILLIKEYQGEQVIGDVYLLKNVSEAVMALDEQEFKEFGDDVKAVAIDVNRLNPGETTALYVVRGVGHE